MNNALQLLVLLSFLNLHSQEVILEIDKPLGQASVSVKSSYSIVDENNNSIVLFLRGKKRFAARVFNNSFDELAVKYYDNALKKSEGIIGHLIRNGVVQIVVWDFETGKIKGLIFNPQAEDLETVSYDLNLKDQMIMQVFESENAISILSINENSTMIEYHTVTPDGTVKTTPFPIENAFYTNKGEEISLYYGAMYGKFVVAEEENSLTTRESLSFHKIYRSDDRITISLDQNNNLVNLIHLSIDDKKVDYQLFSRPPLAEQSEFHQNKANSYLHKDYLYQITANPLNASFSITNILDSTTVKTLSFSKEGGIPFETSDMIIDRGSKTRTIKKPSQFLRNIVGSGAYPSITVQTLDSSEIITLGGGEWLSRESQAQSNNVAMFGLLGFALYEVFKPKNKKIGGNVIVKDISTISFTLNNKFDIIPNKEFVDPLKKIREFSIGKIIRNQNIGETLFQVNGTYYYGRKEDWNFVIRKF